MSLDQSTWSLPEGSRLLVATGNPGKLVEIREILDLPGVEILGPSEAGLLLPDIEETGDTFEANAALKAVGCATELSEHELYVLADDSGLVVDALGGAPGVRSARFAGESASDADNNARLVKELAAFDPPYPARYVAVITVASPDGEIVASARGTCEGTMILHPKGGGGFGYDPFFRPAEQDRHMAELPAEEKHAISHRGKALRTLRAAYADR